MAALRVIWWARTCREKACGEMLCVLAPSALGVCPSQPLPSPPPCHAALHSRPCSCPAHCQKVQPSSLPVPQPLAPFLPSFLPFLFSFPAPVPAPNPELCRGFGTSPFLKPSSSLFLPSPPLQLSSALRLEGWVDFPAVPCSNFFQPALSYLITQGTVHGPCSLECPCMHSHSSCRTRAAELRSLCLACCG